MPEPLNGLLPGRGPGVGRAEVLPPSPVLGAAGTCSADSAAGACGRASGVDGAAVAGAGASGAAGAPGAGEAGTGPGPGWATGAGGAAGVGLATGAGRAAGAGPMGVGEPGAGWAAAGAGAEAGLGATFLAAGGSGSAEAGKASRSLRSTGASMVEAADFTYSPFAFNHATASLLGIPNSLASVLTRTFDTSLLVLVRAHLVSGHGPLVPSGHAHRSELIECSFPFRSSTVECGLIVVRCFDPHPYGTDLERPTDPEGPRERPASLRPVQALEPRMQVCTAARLPGSGIREADAVPGRDPKQFGLDCTVPAADAGARRSAVLCRWWGV